MMRACRSVGAVLSLVLPVGIAAVIAGCQPTPPVTVEPPHPMPPMITGSSGSDHSMVQVFADTKVGIVSEVQSDPIPSECIAVFHVPDPSVSKGDIVTYTDHQQNVVANGTLLSLPKPDEDPSKAYATADYTPATGPGGRAPRRGDWVLIRPATK